MLFKKFKKIFSECKVYSWFPSSSHIFNQIPSFIKIQNIYFCSIFLFQTLSESTHTQLKKNVYQNYRQFIDTAKEISFLESEMYQLSHMITDQRNLLFELMQFSVNGEKVDIELADQILEKNDSASNASKTNR